MSQYTEINGDLIKLAKAGQFDVIAHGCNCFCAMGAGIAPQMAKAFDAHNYSKEDNKYRGDFNKLGTIDYGVHVEMQDGREYNLAHNYLVKMFNKDDSALFGQSPKTSFIVVNAYTQYGFGANHEGGSKQPLDYEALTMCMRKINHEFKGYHIGLPLIGCGLAGGDWEKVKAIIKTELKDMQVTVVHYKP